ncbi:hypothetical protein PAXRUDRAFT_165658 [Paxillus rubicundulus Ve08.2h10]|uniref:Uncharacterized protein n=1 Tax=Paxillus rubicundulus Ve08.2h10 TaxID=930991 RepID=A0A0D0C3S4_9AGAM|nr:hypothetical protein PAXRUDRAFT_165658 [Paxillus rubicundulus Ve08.2h10]
MPCPPDSPWALTDLIMEYMHHRFHAELFPTTDPTSILPDVNIPAEMVCEADQILPTTSQWDIHTCLSEPAILIAESGEAITWYLPAAVSQYNQVGFILKDVAEDTKKWWMDSTLFQRDSKLAGMVNLSPTWFQRGHSVGAFPTFSLRHLI